MPRPERLFFADRRQSAAAALLGAVLLAAFVPTLVEMAKEWWGRPEYGHGLLMPPVAAWMIWDRRKALAGLVRREGAGSRWLPIGAALALVPALALLLLGEMKLSWYLKPYAFVGSLVLSVVVLWGWQGLRALWAPLVVLLLMCPLPWRIILWATLPLKRHATVLATGLIHLTGLPTILQGNLIHVPGTSSLWIADACSGVRSLVSLLSVAVLGSLLWRRHWGLKLVVIASCLPIAIAVNTLRIWLTAVLSVYVSPAFAKGFFHEFEGLVLFGAGSVLLAGWALLLHRLVPRRAPEDRPAAEPEPASPPAAPRPRMRRVALGLAVLLLAVGTVGVYRFRASLGGEHVDPEQVAALRDRLAALPVGIPDAGYDGEAITWSDHTIANSGADAYRSVRYFGSDGRMFDVFIGGAIRNDDNFHSPNVCMPSANWEALSSGPVPFDAYPVHGDQPRMQRMVMQRGTEQMLVYFWFQAGRRLADGEWAVRWYRLLDLIQGRSLEPTLIVTVYVPVVDGVDATEKAAQGLLAALGPYLREITNPGDAHDF